MHAAYPTTSAIGRLLLSPLLLLQRAPLLRHLKLQGFVGLCSYDQGGGRRLPCSCTPRRVKPSPCSSASSAMRTKQAQPTCRDDAASSLARTCSARSNSLETPAALLPACSSSKCAQQIMHTTAWKSKTSHIQRACPGCMVAHLQPIDDATQQQLAQRLRHVAGVPLCGEEACA